MYARRWHGESASAARWAWHRTSAQTALRKTSGKCACSVGLHTRSGGHSMRTTIASRVSSSSSASGSSESASG